MDVLYSIVLGMLSIVVATIVLLSMYALLDYLRKNQTTLRVVIIFITIIAILLFWFLYQ